MKEFGSLSTQGQIVLTTFEIEEISMKNQDF